MHRFGRSLRVMWKEGEGDRMGVEDLDEVEEMFFCVVSFVFI